MGIQGLLPFLKDATEAINIRKYKGHAVAVDTYCWIHRGAVACAVQLAKGEKCDQYVRYCLKFVNMLRSMEITPVLVFDGRHLPAKKSVEESRRKRRELYSQKGRQLLREGKASEARDAFVKCINVTSEMALEVMKAARSLGVDCIVAPYEADAQLAYLERNGFVQAVVTEDSDLLAFGCKRVIFKMDTSGNALEIEQSRLNRAVKMGTYFSVEKFRHMCILAGCDYLPSLTGIGLGKARKFIHTSTNPDIRNVLKRIPLQLKLKVSVTSEYIEGFIRANNTFEHQLAFDPQEKKLVPLTPYPPELADEDMEYAGRYLDSKLAMEVALGNIELNTLNKIFDFKPDFRKQYPRGTPRHKFSIWHDGYRPAPPLLDSGDGDIARKPTKGQEVVVPSNGIVKRRTPKKRRRDGCSSNGASLKLHTDLGSKVISDGENEKPSDLPSLYSGPPDAKMARVDEIETIPETPSPLKERSPTKESGAPSPTKPRMTPRNVFAVKKGHRVDSATRRDMLNSDVTVSSRFFKTTCKAETVEADEGDEMRTGTGTVDGEGMLDVSNHEGGGHIYEPKKLAIDAGGDRLGGGPETSDCIRDHQRKVRATTGRLCDKTVDRTSVLDSLQKFKHSGFTDYYEEQIRIKNEKLRKEEGEKKSQPSPSSKHGRRGAFSWSTKVKKSPSVQRTLTNSAKSLSSFHFTKSSSKAVEWSSEGDGTPDESQPTASEGGVSASPEKGFQSDQKGSVAEVSNSQRSGNLDSQPPKLNSQHSIPDSQQSNLSSSVPASQRSLEGCSIDRDGPTFSQIVRERGEEQRSTAKGGLNPFRKLSRRKESSPDDDELSDLLTEIANDENNESFTEEEEEIVGENSPKRPLSSPDRDGKEDKENRCSESSDGRDGDNDDDISIISVSTPVVKKSSENCRTPKLPSLGVMGGQGRNDRNSPPGSGRTGGKDGEKVSSYFTKSKDNTMKAKGSCKVPGLSKKRRPTAKNSTTNQQPTLMAFIKKKNDSGSDDQEKPEKRLPLSPTKLNENITPETGNVSVLNRPFAARKSIFK